jgi:hypothetical protein
MKWTVELYQDDRGRCPVGGFIRKQGDLRLQVRLIRKMEYVAEILHYLEPHQVTRPRFDTLSGPVKEYIADKQVRLALSFEKDERVVLMLEAERKKNGVIDPRTIERAVRNRDDWIETHRSVPLGGLKEEFGL